MRRAKTPQSSTHAYSACAWPARPCPAAGAAGVAQLLIQHPLTAPAPAPWPPRPPGQVVASRHPDYQEGDHVAGFMTWAEYHLASGGQGLAKVEVAKGRPLSYYIGILGMPGGWQGG